MQLNHWEIFCMVARVRSFSKAAKLLYMSQPAVSNVIHSMEDYYGAKLFHRHNHGVSLTNAGETAYEYAVKILDLHENLEKDIDHMLNQENKKLVVGASSSVGNYALPCSIWTFKEKYPEIEISLEISNTANIIQYVLEEKVHLGVVEGPVTHGGLAASEVFADTLILAVPPSGEWQEREEISVADIKKYPLIMRESGSGIRRIWEDVILQNGLQPGDFKVAAEMSSIDAIKSAVESGLGVAVISRLSAQKEIQRGTLKCINIQGIPLDIKFQVIYLREKVQAGIAARFMRFLSRPEERSFC